MLKNKKVSLRALEETDLPILRDWRNNEDFRKFFREHRELNLTDQKNWFDRFVVKNDSTIMFGIVDNENDELIGVCGLCYIDWINRFADLSIYIGKNNLYIDTKENGFAWAALNILLDFAFNKLGLHKVWNEIYSFDNQKKELCQKYGFHQDGILRDNYYYNGKYQNSLILSLLAKDFKIKNN